MRPSRFATSTASGPYVGRRRFRGVPILGSAGPTRRWRVPRPVVVAIVALHAERIERRPELLGQARTEPGFHDRNLPRLMAGQRRQRLTSSIQRLPGQQLLDPVHQLRPGRTEHHFDQLTLGKIELLGHPLERRHR